MSLVKITGNAVDGWIREPAPSIINTDGQPNYSPSVTQLNALGYYDEPSNQPDNVEGKVSVLIGYDVFDCKWRALYRYDDAPHPPPKVWRRIIIWRELKALNAWSDFRQFLADKDLLDAWYSTNELAEDFDLGGGVTVSGLFSSVRQILPITDEQWTQTLAEAEVRQ